MWRHRWSPATSYRVMQVALQRAEVRSTGDAYRRRVRSIADHPAREHYLSANAALVEVLESVMKRKMFEKIITTTINTGGDGFWSRAKKPVRLHNMVLIDMHDGGSHFGELRVQFIVEDWDRAEHGLIYTDRQFKHEFKHFLEEQFGIHKPGLDDLDYSEQGMQGKDYVSFDCGPEFIKSYIEATT